MTTLRALLYADVRSFVNQLRDIRRSPSRAVLWCFFVLGIAGLIVLRVVGTGRRAAHAPAGDIATDGIVCGALFFLGLALVFGGRYAGLFAHPAEARFIIGSPATPFVATLYVQARQIVRGGARQAFGLLYIALLYLPATLPAAVLGRDIALIAGAFIAIAAVPLARQLLARPLVPLALGAGWLCILAGPLLFLRDAVAPFADDLPGGALLLQLPAWHPGAILLAPAGAGASAILIVFASTAALLVSVARGARDAYPELYELSIRRLQRTERLRGGPFTAVRAAAGSPARVESLTSGAPRGVAIFIWRGWTEYRRTHDPRSTGFEAALVLSAGYATARLASVAGSDVLLAIASPVVNIIFILAVMRSATLASELRRPLFWLSDATLFERLAALGIAQGWRLIGWCVLAGIGLAAGGASAPPLVTVFAAGPAAVCLAGAIGYASYALVPNDVDQRGPLLFLRLLIGYVLVVPPLATGIALGLLVRSPVVALGGAGGAMVLEAALLLGFAAWRLDRMSIALN